MESLILRLEDDVRARKRPRSEARPLLRLGALLLMVFAAAFELGARSVDSAAGWAASLAARQRMEAASARADALQGRLDLQGAQIQRFQRIHQYSATYGIGADLAAAIHDTALAEGIDPSVAFELVRVESQFTRDAVSSAGAVGYAQVMPATAELLAPGITRAELFERDVNLRLGFRFLDALIRRYDGDLRLALLAYNRGPITVDSLLARGVDPANGYARAVLGR